MVRNPKISLIMPVYNAVNYMDKPIKSILNQTLQDIELICVNDVSTDDSLKRLKEYQNEDKRIKIINNQKNVGPGISRNNGIKRAKGEYICFVDSDDWLESDALELLYKKSKEENSDLVFIKPKFVFTNKVILDKRLLKKEEYKDKNKVLKATMERKIAWAPWSKMVRRNLLIKNNIFFPDIYVAEDMDFSCKTIHFSKKISIEEKYLYNYYLHEGSLTSYKNAERRVKNYFESIGLLRNFLKEKKILNKLEKEFLYFKLYNYLAIWGVLDNTRENFDKKKYKSIVRKDSDFRFSKIISLNKLDSVVIGCFAIKIGFFSKGLKIREFFRKILGKWGKRNS